MLLLSSETKTYMWEGERERRRQGTTTGPEHVSHAMWKAWWKNVDPPQQSFCTNRLLHQGSEWRYLSKRDANYSTALWTYYQVPKGFSLPQRIPLRDGDHIYLASRRSHSKKFKHFQSLGDAYRGVLETKVFRNSSCEVSGHIYIYIVILIPWWCSKW